MRLSPRHIPTHFSSSRVQWGPPLIRSLRISSKRNCSDFIQIPNILNAFHHRSSRSSSRWSGGPQEESRKPSGRVLCWPTLHRNDICITIASIILIDPVFLFVFVLVNVFAIAAIGTCQILIGGLCLPKGYPPTHHTSFVDIFLPNKMAFLHKIRFSTK